MNRVKHLLTKIAIVSSILGFGIAPLAYAGEITSKNDTMTRLKIGTTANHSVVFTLPTGIDFDSASQTDILRVDFPESSAFTQGGTWATADFTFNDGSARTVQNVSAGAGTIDCTVSTAENVCIAIDTTNLIFTVKPAATYTAGSTGATITLGIQGITPGGTLTNPSSTGSYTLSIAECDETASCTSSFTTTHSGSLAVAIVDDDTVNVSASVDPSISFDIDTPASGATCTETAASYNVAFSTITTSDVEVSGTTDGVQRICLDLATNAASGANVTVKSTNASLKSTSTPADTIASSTATMAAGTANYGLCVVTAASGLTAASPFASTCAVDSNTNSVGALSGSTQNILTSTGPLSAGTSTVAANAAISATTKAHTDYTDQLTFIATGTF